MEIYLKCYRDYTARDNDGHPENKIIGGKIYRATHKYPGGSYSNINTSDDIWPCYHFQELSKVEVFVYLKGRMDLVEALP
jgi:hypothetical protein